MNWMHLVAVMSVCGVSAHLLKRTDTNENYISPVPAAMMGALGYFAWTQWSARRIAGDAQMGALSISDEHLDRLDEMLSSINV
jgi:hypothetical protein